MKNRLDRLTFDRLITLEKSHHWLKKRDHRLLSLLRECRSATEIDLVLHLLKSWRFITSADVEDATQTIADHICEEWQLSASSTLITAIADSGKPDGSQAIVQSLKQQLPGPAGWKESNFRNSLTSSLSIHRKNIVFIDDFTGTGEKIKRKVRWYKQKLKKKGYKSRIYFCSLACMKFGEPTLAKMKIQYFSPIWLNQGIRDSASGIQRYLFYKDMERLDRNLGSLPKHYSLGYKGSEALYSQEAFGVPNNVFPVFWWDRLVSGRIRETLFKRAYEE